MRLATWLGSGESPQVISHLSVHGREQGGKARFS